MTPESLRPAPGMLLKEKAYLAIKKQILNRQLRPGQSLSERRIATSLRMSKTPVREALERLVREQFISVAPQQGYRVRGCSIRELAEHYEFRRALEPYFLREAAGNLTPEQAKLLETNIEQHSEATSGKEVKRAIELDIEFHLLFARFLGNREMLQVMSQVCERMFRVLLLVLETDSSRFAKCHMEHRGIAEAVLAGDKELAATKLIDHLEHSAAVILAVASQPRSDAEGLAEVI